MTTVHPTAVVSPNAQLGTGVSVGPGVIIGDGCEVGDDCILEPRAVLERNVRLATGVRVGIGSVLGGDPQDLKFKGEMTRLEIGARNMIREFVTIHRGTQGCAGDFGHICVDPNGPICSCGNTGCLQSMAAAPAMVLQAERCAREGESTALAEILTEKGELNTIDVGEAARRSDYCALTIIRRSGRLIGQTLAAVPTMSWRGAATVSSLEEVRPAPETSPASPSASRA